MILRKLSWQNPKMVFTFSSLLFIGLFYFFLNQYYYHYDDAFITYTYARNLAAGHGMVFYPFAQHVQGSSTLLYTILLATLSKISTIQPDILGILINVVLFVALQGLSILLINDIIGKSNSSWQLNILLFTFQTPLLFSLGLETTLMCCLLTASIFFILKRKAAYLSAVLVLIPLTRLDYLFFFPVIGLCVFVFWDKHIWAMLKIFGPSFITTLIYLVFAKIYFTAWMPHSWMAKGLVPWSAVSGTMSWHGYLIKYPELFCYLFIISFSIGWSALRLKNRRSSAVSNRGTFVCISYFLWSLAYTFVLIYKKAPDMPWYYVGSIYSGYLLICILVMRWQVEGIRKAASVVFMTTFALNLIMGVNISKGFEHGLVDKRGHSDRREIVGRLLERAIPDIKNKTLLVYEAGKIPYYSGAKCIDLLGLVSNESVDGLKKGDTSITLMKTVPDLIAGLNNPSYFPMKFIRSPYFKENYRELYKVDDYSVWVKVD